MMSYNNRNVGVMYWCRNASMQECKELQDSAPDFGTPGPFLHRLRLPQRRNLPEFHTEFLQFPARRA